MMKHEFESIAGYTVSDDDYNKIIEPMYMATSLSKEEFAKALDRNRFEYVAEKSPERIRLEEEINASIKEFQEAIDFLKRDLEIKEDILSVEEDPKWINIWKSDIKNYKDSIKEYRNIIKKLKWVLA